MAAMVLATGSRSEQTTMRLLPDVDPVCFVEVGNFTGIALHRAAADGTVRATLVAVVGKITKLAADVMMTHFHRSRVDNAVLREAATASGAPLPVLEAATETATAGHFCEICVLHHALLPLQRLCRRASEACRAHVGGALDVEVWMVDSDGLAVVARG